VPRQLRSEPLDEVFAALANPTRRAILDVLLEGETTAGALSGRFDMARPSVSEHLRVLREAGLVEERQEGRHRHYRVTGGPMAELVDWLNPYERFWRGRLASLGRVLDRMETDDDHA